MNSKTSYPAIMGIVNVTPDSFSDGGKFLDHNAALTHGLALIEDGADILDVGGQSTRPGATPIAQNEEAERVLPVIEALRARTDCPISIDTMQPDIARAAIGAGANIWNDVSALRADPSSPDTAAALGVKVVMMHMRGTPASMQNNPHYTDILAEVIAFLQDRIRVAVAAGIKQQNLLVDPGIGFGKTCEHNLVLMRNLSAIAEATGCPLLLGASRKSFIQTLDPKAKRPTERLGGSIAASLHALAQGAAIIRVHDVRQTRQAMTIITALQPPDQS